MMRDAQKRPIPRELQYNAARSKQHRAFLKEIVHRRVVDSSKQVGGLDDYIMKVVQNKSDQLKHKSKRGDMRSKMKAFVKDGKVMDLDQQFE